MHLSLLSDSFLSDRLNDAGIWSDHDRPDVGRAHRDGVVRGLCFVAALACPVILTLGASVVDSAARVVSDGPRVASPALAMPPLRMERRS